MLMVGWEEEGHPAHEKKLASPLIIKGATSYHTWKMAIKKGIPPMKKTCFTPYYQGGNQLPHLENGH